MINTIKYVLLLLAITSMRTVNAQEVEHVILISIDGFRPDFYTDAKWPTPNIKMLAKEGVFADEVRTIFPSVTYPSHTTLVTGVFPEKHGIYYNTTIGDDGQPSGWVYDYNQITSKTIWEVAKSKNLSTASISWPITMNNPYIDYNIPEIWSFEDASDRRGATSKAANPKGLFEEITSQITGTLEKEEYNLSSLRMDQNLGRMATYLIEKYQPNLLTIHLPNTDGAQHSVGREGVEVERAIAGADQVVGQIYDAVLRAGIAEKTAILVTGDHGFVTTHTSISANLWLKEHGLSDKAFFFSTGGSAFLHLKNGNSPKILEKIHSVLDSLPLAQRNMFRIIEESQLREMQSDPRVKLAISANEGFSFDNDTDGELLKSKVGGKHGYFPDFYNIYTGFVGYGAGFKSGIEIKHMQLEDIAPLVAKLLNLELKDSSGTVYPGLLKH
ncbi:alkaline phosphatase family protein [Leeuwenhoekiella sp. MAR_2009_132]|nr:ectonucleotide pyrophosphatase/phosphodiesterase [Leeuwenhoekiella sp. MAR_2009_132]